MGEPAMVLENARPHLKSLTKLATDLNEASDRYTEELKAIEEELKALNLGLEVTLAAIIRESDRRPGRTDEGTDEQKTTIFDRWYLAYGRDRSFWHLLLKRFRVEAVSDEYEEVISETFIEDVPLVQASRDLRIEAAKYIPDLLALLQEEAKTKIAALKKVSDTRKS